MEAEKKVGRFKRELGNKTVKIWGWIQFLCERKEGNMNESQVPNLHNPTHNGATHQDRECYSKTKFHQEERSCFQLILDVINMKISILNILFACRFMLYLSLSVSTGNLIQWLLLDSVKEALVTA